MPLALIFATGCAASSPAGPAEGRATLAAAIAGRSFDPDDPPAIARDEASAGALLSLARDPGERPRYIAHRAASLLRHHPRREIYEGLLELVESDDDGVREAALGSLGLAFTKRYARPLAALAEELRGDDDPGVRRAARELLVRAKAARFTP